VVALFLVSLGLTQGSDSAFDGFLQQVLSEIGLVIEECPKTDTQDSRKAVCSTTEMDFERFKQRWDVYSSIHADKYGIEVFKAWSKRSDGTYSRHYIYANGPGVLSIYYNPLRSGQFFFIAIW